MSFVKWRFPLRSHLKNLCPRQKRNQMWKQKVVIMDYQGYHLTTLKIFFLFNKILCSATKKNIVSLFGFYLYFSTRLLVIMKRIFQKTQAGFAIPQMFFHQPIWFDIFYFFFLFFLGSSYFLRNSYFFVLTIQGNGISFDKILAKFRMFYFCKNYVCLTLHCFRVSFFFFGVEYVDFFLQEKSIVTKHDYTTYVCITFHCCNFFFFLVLCWSICYFKPSRKIN